MINIHDLIPGIMVTPGDVIKDELKARKMKKKDLAKNMGGSVVFVEAILSGRQLVYASVALNLQDALGIDAETWLNLQHNCLIDLEKLRNKNEFELLKKLQSRKKI